MMNRIKTLQELNLLDRFLFSEVMADNEILEDVLEIILDRPVPLKDKAQAEKELRRTPQNKSVYFAASGRGLQSAQGCVCDHDHAVRPFWRREV